MCVVVASRRVRKMVREKMMKPSVEKYSWFVVVEIVAVELY